MANDLAVSPGDGRAGLITAGAIEIQCSTSSIAVAFDTSSNVNYLSIKNFRRIITCNLATHTQTFSLHRVLKLKA
jgi:hypothetical protein